MITIKDYHHDNPCSPGQDTELEISAISCNQVQIRILHNGKALSSTWALVDREEFLKALEGEFQVDIRERWHR